MSQTLLITLLFAIAAITLFILWSRSRREHVHFEIPPGVHGASLMRSIAALTWGRVMEGNAVRIVQDAGFFDAFLDDAARATHHVHLETFLWMNGDVSDHVVDALSACARRGIEVRVLVDQRGGKTTSSNAWRTMIEAGVDFRVYHRARPRELGWYNTRDHRKIVVVDGRIGYTFGHGIADMWGAGRAGGWRDTAARFEGPVVGELQMAFLENWIKVNGRALVGDAYFPRLEPAGTIPMHVAWAAPPETASAVQRLYYLAIASARREIILQNPYFIPDRHAVRLYSEAVARGVAVKLMLPTSGTSDFPIVQHASHYYYGPLLRAGATIYEYTASGIHQKVLIVDREWCTIGSTNFDPRSFHINDEISVAIYDAGVAEELAAAFQEDIKGAELWTTERWNARTFPHRVRDRASVLVKWQL
ncbi:MAG TPA: phospholipase D-like domain-containing protein [Thermoanaerobaculia bacterium]|nr:phospholipase D-like domain-containing protein [Thermoanaerobaculia bacterium]